MTLWSYVLRSIQQRSVSSTYPSLDGDYFQKELGKLSPGLSTQLFQLILLSGTQARGWGRCVGVLGRQSSWPGCQKKQGHLRCSLFILLAVSPLGAGALKEGDSVCPLPVGDNLKRKNKSTSFTPKAPPGTPPYARLSPREGPAGFMLSSPEPGVGSSKQPQA